RSHALLSIRGGRAALASNRAAGLRAFRRRGVCATQGLVRSLFLPQASQRDTGRRRTVLRRPERMGLRALLCLPAQRGRSLPAGVPADRRTAQGPALWRARTAIPAVSPRPLRRVQPGIRSRHILRAAVRRSHRIHSHVAAAAGPLGIRLAPRARLAGSTPLQRFPASTRLAARARLTPLHMLASACAHSVRAGAPCPSVYTP